MELLLNIVGIIFPVFFTIFIGLVCKRIGVFSDSFIKEGNHLVFHLFMPLYMFVEIVTSNNINELNGRVLLYILVAEMVVLCGGMIILGRTNKPDDVKATILQAFLRPNLLLLGIALATSYYGGGEKLGKLILTLGFLAPITNLFSVLSFEVYDLKGTGLSPIKIIKNIINNKLILAAIIGILFKVAGISLPKPILEPLVGLSKVTTPLGLLFIGGSLVFERNKTISENVTVAVIGRNLIIPILGIGMAMFLGFSGSDLFAIMICLSAPVAVSSYVMAVSYTQQGQLASRIVMTTTLISGFVIFLELYIFSILKLL